MREITSHRVNPANDTLTIRVLDEPGSGGACHHYEIAGFDTSTNAANDAGLGYRRSFALTPILFQNGPINEVGVNGITHEALLAILIDRLESFQRGPFANGYNGVALAHLHAAQFALQERTRERMARDVEGTHEK